MHNRLALKLVAPAELPDDAFGWALANTTAALGRYARLLTGSASDADDLVQDTVAHCWAALSSFRAGANLAAWARTIMRNSFIPGFRGKSSWCPTIRRASCRAAPASANL
ncbi:RNA polymerase sigma factor [uncultured Sphingomonas sp.]|uniref:RNA polymerase sigma factor n=1 Tax=uncultured Sphingomonas sp. TaxID=158754 RepID=UPI0035CB5C57